MRGEKGKEEKGEKREEREKVSVRENRKREINCSAEENVRMAPNGKTQEPTGS